MIEAHEPVAHASTRESEIEEGYAFTADARASAAASIGRLSWMGKVPQMGKFQEDWSKKQKFYIVLLQISTQQAQPAGQKRGRSEHGRRDEIKIMQIGRNLLLGRFRVCKSSSTRDLPLIYL